MDAASLAASAAIDPSQAVGDRIVEPGAFDTVELLQPGETAGFSITVPRDLLGITEPGAYWFGVHAIGDSSVPRDTFADGRARTFLPYVARTRETVETSIVVPVREQVRHTAAGRVAGMRRWSASLADGGRLESLLDVGEAADGAPLTWLVDPAVLATVSRLSAGNPPRSLAPDPAAVPAEGTEGTEGDGVAPARPRPSSPGAPRWGPRRPRTRSSRPTRRHSRRRPRPGWSASGRWSPARRCWPCPTATSTCPPRPPTARCSTSTRWRAAPR